MGALCNLKPRDLVPIPAADASSASVRSRSFEPSWDRAKTDFSLSPPWVKLEAQLSIVLPQVSGAKQACLQQQGAAAPGPAGAPVTHPAAVYGCE